jgi:hypothetical protein
LLTSSSCSAFGHENRVADLDGGGQGLRVLDGVQMRPVGRMHQVVEGRRTCRLHYGKSRQPVDQAKILEFAQAFAECRDVAQVPARQHHPVGHAPIALVQHLRHDGLLALDAEGIDRVSR